MVSRKNCKISFAGGRWVVEDLGSSNGTFVNEVRVQKQALNHADVVRCGTLQVRFVETADAAAGRRAASRARCRSRPRAAAAAGASQVDPALQQAFGRAAAGSTRRRSCSRRTTSCSRRCAGARHAGGAAARGVAGARGGAAPQRGQPAASCSGCARRTWRYRDRLGEIQREKSLQDDEIHALTKVGNELREELEALKGEHLTNKQRVEELTDEMSARERQLERAHEDVQRAKQIDGGDARQARPRLQKTKDEGWKELNDAHRRDRAPARGHQRAGAHARGAPGRPDLAARRRSRSCAPRRSARSARSSQLKTERDELRDKVIRQNHQVEALEEEQRRLARMLSDGGGGGGGGGDNTEHVRLATEVRELKVELRKVETERTRCAERLETTERERAQLEEQLAQLDVDRAVGDAVEGRPSTRRARGSRRRSRKAEVARAKAEEALAEAQSRRARAAAQAADRAKVDADRERKRAVELELELKVTREATQGATPAMLAAAAHPQLRRLDGGDRGAGRGARAPARGGDRAARAGAGARTAAAAAADGERRGHGDDRARSRRRPRRPTAASTTRCPSCAPTFCWRRIWWPSMARRCPDHEAARTLEDAINVSVDRTEDAKGLLARAARSDRELTMTDRATSPAHAKSRT